jgi:hypothetical protein
VKLCAAFKRSVVVGIDPAVRLVEADARLKTKNEQTQTGLFVVIKSVFIIP